MATRFGGFTPQQQQVLLSLAGYQGPAQQDDLNKFMMASPKAASMMGISQLTTLLLPILTMSI